MISLSEHSFDVSLPGLDDLYDPYATRGKATKQDIQTFFEAARSGKKDIVRKILDNTDINVDEVGETGLTALMEAVKANETKVARVLISRGASVNLMDHLGAFTDLLI
jgi:ankyrin repeat protein